MDNKPLVGIIMGSESDLDIMQEAGKILEEFQVPFEVNIISAHRTPDFMIEYAKTAIERGLRVIIAGAGGSAHVPGMIAALATLPVIGVPIKTKSLEGLDSLLSIVQMPAGVPVATVAINGARNAGILAVEILASSDDLLRQKLDHFKVRMKNKVLSKGAKLNNMGYKKFLELLQK